MSRFRPAHFVSTNASIKLPLSRQCCYDPDPIFHFAPSSLSPRSPTPSATYPHPRDALPRPTVKVPSPLVHSPSPHAPAEPPATSDDLIKVRPFHSSHAAPDCPTAIHCPPPTPPTPAPSIRLLRTF